jgi:hypothetical protein
MFACFNLKSLGMGPFTVALSAIKDKVNSYTWRQKMHLIANWGNWLSGLTDKEGTVCPAGSTLLVFFAFTFCFPEYNQKVKLLVMEKKM